MDRPAPTATPLRSPWLLAALLAPGLAPAAARAQAPTVQFSMPSYTVNENIVTASIMVSLSAPSMNTVTVSYATSNGTATAPGDYTSTSGQLTFSPNTTSQMFSVMIANDALDESDETVTLTLSNPINATLGAPSTTTLTITDDDPPPPPPPTVQFSTTGYTVMENMMTASIEVTLSGSSVQTVTVSYATSNGTATAGADYQAASGTLSFPPGIMSQSFTVTITNDFAVEPSETINLALSGPANATLGAQSTATLTITDEDVPPPTVQFSTAGYTVNENTVTASVMVSLSAPYGQQVTVGYATGNGTATAPADYTAASGTVTFPPNNTSQMFSVTIANDGLDENDETVNLTLSSPTNATLGAQSTATLTITDDDPEPMVQFSAVSPLTVSEGAGSVTLTVMLMAASAKTVTVQYATADGSATSPADYAAANGTLTFNPGETSKTFSVTIAGDSLDETDEEFTASLSGAVNAMASGSPLTVRITDDDAPPAVQLSASNPASVSEAAGTATFTATLSAASGLTVTVPYNVAVGTAMTPDDFSATNGTLTFNPGETSKTFSVTIANDSLDEPDEDFTISLGAPTNATQGSPPSQTVTITDDDDPPAVQFSAASYSISENMASATITVNLGAASAKTVTVSYATSNGTAVAPDDYTVTNGTLTFTPGQTSQTFMVSVMNDAIAEPSETVNLALSSPSNATLGSQSTATLTITDDDPPPPPPPTVQFAMAGYTVMENMMTASVEVTLSGSSMQTVTVSYATGNGTATAGADYQTASGTLSIMPGMTSASFTVTILNDSQAEPNETINLTLSNPVNATLGSQSTATLTITDDDPPPPTVSFSTPTYTVSEGAATASITVSLSAPYGEQVTVSYATSDGTATAPGDYTAASGTLTFPPDSTSQTFSITVANDGLDEDDETVNLTLSGPTNATLGAQSTATLTITDDDPEPMVQFSGPGPVTVSEGAGSVTLTVTLMAASAKTVTVQYATSDGTATAPGDYAGASGTLTFAPGETSKTFSVTIANDSLDEPDESFTASLSNAVNATLGGTVSQTVTVTDDDPPPTVQLSASNPTTVAEGAGSVTLTVALSAAAAQTVTVSYGTAMGTAQDPADFTAASGTLTFSPGETSKTFSVTVVDDALDEDDETFTVSLSAPTYATLGTTTSQTVTITDDDDPPEVQFSAAGYTASENAGGAIITVTLSAPSAKTVTVPYATGDGTATEPSDYSPASGTLTFAPGETSQTFMVSVVDDAAVEDTEFLLLGLNSPMNATLGTFSMAALVIADDDVPSTPTVQFSQSSHYVNESDGSVTITVTLTGSTTETVTVNYATSNGSAAAPADYTPASGTLSFAPGETRKTFSVGINSDSEAESAETISLSLSSPLNAALGIIPNATITVCDDGTCAP